VSELLRIEGLTKVYGSMIAVDGCDLEVAEGEFVTLLGPSGSGKSTIIRMVAGYVPPTSGRVILRGTDVTSMPPRQRKMGMVFQDYALFPHMRVSDNVGFGISGPDRSAGGRRALRRDRDARVAELLELVGLAGAGDKYPSELSGGMQQRVALARALAIRPSVLLLDEPFSSLDAKLRASLQVEVKRIQQETGVTTVFVTHDQHEALSMSDRIAVMAEGRIEQVGTPKEIYGRPQSPFVLDFIGRSTAIRASVVDVDGAAGVSRCRVGEAQVAVAGTDHGVDDAVLLALRPESVTLSPGSTADGRVNSFSGIVEGLRFVGSSEHATVAVPQLGARVVCAASVGAHQVGDPVAVSFEPTDVIVLGADDADPAGVIA
jgi:ABC-type Fe3+/spermidine/putrescine transport system ATPase subunit